MVDTINPTTILGLILGGVLALLYGIRLISDTMQQDAGMWLRRSLMLLTRYPLAALGAGIGMTMLTQSSGATSSLLVSLVSVQLLPPTIAVITLLGTNIGSALTVQLLIFHITDFAFVFIGLGSAIALLTRHTSRRGIGQACFGFALVILGLAALQEGSGPLAASHITALVFMALAQSPLVLVLLGVILSMTFASSVAGISLVIVMVSNGALPLAAAVAMILGSNVGSTITALLTAFSSKSLAGRRLALIHVGTKLSLASVALLALNPLSAALASIALPVGTLIVLSHLAFNLILAIIFTPLAKPLTKLMEKLVPEQTTGELNSLHYLHPDALALPAVALGQAIREVLHMTDLISQMLDLSILAFQGEHNTIPARIAELDDQVDSLNTAIKLYLTQLEEEKMSAQQKNRQIALLYVITDLEAMGDLLDKQCMRLARRKSRQQLSFSSQGWQDLVIYHHAIAEAVQKAFAALAAQDAHLATSFFASKRQLNDMKQKMQVQHMRRLQSGALPTLASSEIHLDLLTVLRSMLSHASTIAHVVQEDLSVQEDIDNVQLSTEDGIIAST